MNPYPPVDYPVEKAIELGRSIGKVPLVCDGNVQSLIANELWWRHGIRERETVQERDERQRCPSCGYTTPEEQEAHRHPRMKGFCGPGRCVVNATVWLVTLKGAPL